MDTEANDLKVRENRLRRAAVRQGLFLSRRRRRDINARDFGRYALLRGGRPAHGVDAEGFYTLTLDDVERLLAAPPGEAPGDEPGTGGQPAQLPAQVTNRLRTPGTVPVEAVSNPGTGAPRRRGLGSRAARRGHR